MSDGRKTYEGMFLVDAGNPDFHAASEPARAVLDRYEAEILAIKPWEERRLAYEVRGRRRGLYILTYFKAQPDRIAELERDCQLDERILRLLVLRRDNLTEQQINAETPATAGAKRAAARKAEEKTALPPETGQEGDAKPDKQAPPAEAPPEQAAEKPAEEKTPDEPAAKAGPVEQAEGAAEAQDAGETSPAAESEAAGPAPPEGTAQADESEQKPGSP